MASIDPIDVAFEFVEAINRRDLERLVALMAHDHRFVDLSGEVHFGRETMRSAWESYFDSFPKYMIHVADLFRDGDRVIMVGRTTGSHLNLPRAVEFSETMIWLAETAGGQVTGWLLYEDNPQIRAELGAGPSTRVA